MATDAGSKQRVLTGRRQVCVPCPGCESVVGLWLSVMEHAELQARHPLVDVTAALSDPGDRAAAMLRSSQAESQLVAVPWVSCLLCGYDGLYQFGGGMPGHSVYQAGVGADLEDVIDRIVSAAL